MRDASDLGGSVVLVTLDELMRKVDQTEPDRKRVERRVLEVIAALDLRVDEASGEIVPKVRPHPIPRQRGARWY